MDNGPTVAVSEFESTEDSSASPELDEAYLALALTRLHEMHIKLRLLRETIPALVKTIRRAHISPEELYNEIHRAAIESVNNIQDFTSLVKDSKNQEILSKVHESRKNDEQGITHWLVTHHAGWLDETTERDVVELKPDEKKDIDTAIQNHSEVKTSITVSKFQEAHKDVKISMEDGTEQMTIYLPPPAHLRFDVGESSTNEKKTVYGVSLNETSSMHAGILRAITKRPRSNDLEYLLEMLSSYSDVKTRPCVKCKKLLDFNAQFPVIRIGRTRKESNQEVVDAWDALHLGCEPL